MTDDQLERYLELCKEMFDRFSEDDSWPWRIDPEGWERRQAEMQAFRERLETRELIRAGNGEGMGVCFLLAERDHHISLKDER